MLDDSGSCFLINSQIGHFYGISGCDKKYTASMNGFIELFLICLQPFLKITRNNRIIPSPS